jgi:hypothetical protein
VHGNIHYLGAAGEHIWSDYNDPRGFHIFDSELRSLDFIPNPYTMHSKLFYNDAVQDGSSKIDPGRIKDKIVKLIVRSRVDSERYNDYVIQVEKAQPLELSIVEDHLNLDKINDEVLVSDTKDTLTIIRDYVSQTNNVVDHVALDGLIVDLYKEAQGMEQ